MPYSHACLCRFAQRHHQDGDRLVLLPALSREHVFHVVRDPLVNRIHDCRQGDSIAKSVQISKGRTKSFLVPKRLLENFVFKWPLLHEADCQAIQMIKVSFISCAQVLDDIHGWPNVSILVLLTNKNNATTKRSCIDLPVGAPT